ncbi:MAG: hypothetical protein ACOYL6_03195 [Bacteriovoracaceae bacterium]
MKKSYFFLPVLFVFVTALQQPVFAQYKTQKNVPDILIQTKMGSVWSEYLIKKVRTFFVNNELGDFFKYEIKKPISTSFKPLKGTSDPQLTKIIEAVQKLFNIKFVDAQVIITVNGLNYKMDKLSTKMVPLSTPGSELVSDTLIGISDLSIETPQIHFDVQIPGKNGEMKSFFSFNVNDLLIQSTSEEILEFSTQIRFAHNAKNNYNFKVISSDFSPLEKKLAARADLLAIDEKVNFDFPEVKIKVGDRVTVFPAAKINRFIKEQLPFLKSFAVKQFVNILKDGEAQQLLKLLETTQFDREYWTDLSLMSMFSFDHITNNDKGDIVVEMSSDYCTQTEFEFNGKDCYDRDYKQDVIRPGNEQRIVKSVNIMNDLIRKEQGNIVISASEEYLTRILKKTFDAGFWDSSFKDLPVALGPKKMIVLFNEKGNDGTLYLDLLYNTSKLERLATGLKQVKFAMMMKINAKIENVKGTPNLVVNISDINMNDDFLLYGDKDTGFISTIHQSRFKKTVIKTVKGILKEQKLIGQDILTIELPEIRDLSLETAHLFSDGHGRVMGLLKLEKNTLNGVDLTVDQFKNLVPIATKY